MEVVPQALIIDRDEASLRQIAASLETVHVTPRWATSQVEALRVIHGEKVDGVFINWDAPDLAGDSLTRQVRCSPSNSHAPVVMLTARHDAKTVVDAQQSGVSHFLTLPLALTQLARLLNDICEKMMDERRRYQRVSVKVPIGCSWVSGRSLGHSLNISATGMLARLNARPSVGHVAWLHFELAPHDFHLQGRVVRADSPDRVALEFALVQRNDRDRLRASLARLTYEA